MSSYFPSKFKYKKYQKQLYRFSKISESCFILKINSLIIKSLYYCRLYPNQLESFRRVVKHLLKRKGLLSFYFLCDLPVTEKSTGIRMGKGKGNIKTWISNIKKGRLIYSLNNISFVSSKYVLSKGLKKLPVKTLIINNVVPISLLRIKLDYFY